jgi:hypothetical protein
LSGIYIAAGVIMSIQINYSPDVPVPRLPGTEFLDASPDGIFLNDVELRTAIDSLIDDLLASLADAASATKDQQLDLVLKRFETFFKKLEEQARAEKMGGIATIFKFIGLAALLAISVALFPICPPIAAISTAATTAFIADAAYTEISGNDSFMLAAFTKLCAGNESVGKWVLLGFEVAIGLLTGGAMLVGKGLTTGLNKLMSKVSDLCKSAAQSVAHGATATQKISDLARLLKEAVLAACKGVLKNPTESFVTIAQTLGLVGGTVTAGLNIAEQLLHLRMAKSQHVIDLLDALLFVIERASTSLLDEMRDLMESRGLVTNGFNQVTSQVLSNN